jgi:hypothetical protein
MEKAIDYLGDAKSAYQLLGTLTTQSLPTPFKIATSKCCKKYGINCEALRPSFAKMHWWLKLRALKACANKCRHTKSKLPPLRPVSFYKLI